MELKVEGLDAARSRLDKPQPFVHLWGKYVHGFKPWKHCYACLKGTLETSVRPDMNDGTYPMTWGSNLFYLCGVGQDVTAQDKKHLWRNKTNVHLAVRKKDGCVASVESAYGVTFTITDAEQISIQKLESGFAGLDKAYYDCKNFQFGWQVFHASEEMCGIKGKDADVVWTKRPEYASLTASRSKLERTR